MCKFGTNTNKAMEKPSKIRNLQSLKIKIGRKSRQLIDKNIEKRKINQLSIECY